MSQSVSQPWVVDSDGIVSISLRKMTVTLSLAISATLLVMLYLSCNDGTGDYVCTVDRFPMISDVVAQTMYDRIFLLMTAVFSFGVQQVNIRAYYRKLWGLIPAADNDRLFWIGLASLAALPMVAVFDESWNGPHTFFALIVFICFSTYGRVLSNYLLAHKDAFSPADQRQIELLNIQSWVMVTVTAAFLAAIHAWGSRGVTGILEWITVMLFFNFFCLASVVNPFFDSIRKPSSS